MSDRIRDVGFRDLFRGLDMAEIETPNEIKIPDEVFKRLLEGTMERSYLNGVSQFDYFVPDETERHGEVEWLQIIRLPVHPDNIEDYDLINRWQGVLSTLHIWGYRTVFLLQRTGGRTSLYLGVTTATQGVGSKDALDQMMEATAANMPGVAMEWVRHDQTKDDRHEKIYDVLNHYHAIGAVTGIPSFISDESRSVLQTLDQLAFGVRKINGRERDYSLLVIADPIPDNEISSIINRMRELGSEIHKYVSRSVTENQGTSSQKDVGMGGAVGGILSGLGTVAGALIGSWLGAPYLGSNLGRGIGGAVGGAVGMNKTKSVSINFSRSVTTEYLDKFAQYAEEIMEKHIARLKEGRNLGYWNVGTYVLGRTKMDIATVTGMLRSIYSGDETYLEPIRLHVLREDSNAAEIVKGFQLISLENENIDKMIDNEYKKKYEQDHIWHVFGRRYQYLSTPMNTKELGLTTSLPRRDVPGLRFVKTAVRFANNPPVLNEDSISIGKVVDMGVVQNNEYRIDPNSLVRHALVTGGTGSGKSTTCKAILNEVVSRGIPVLIIEPAKDDYVRWAMELKEKKGIPFHIYMPGASSFNGQPLEELAVNPFEPAAVKGAKVDLMARCENLVSLLVASIPSIEDVLPVLIDELVYAKAEDFFQEDFHSGEAVKPFLYPKMEDLIPMVDDLVEGYDPRNYKTIRKSLITRLKYLTRGNRGRLLNVTKSTDYDALFGQPTVINLSRIAGSRDKALIMALLMLSLYEYRISAYSYQADYRKRAQQNELLHLTMIEEAHNLLMNPSAVTNDSGNPQQVVADLFSNMLSEIRGYGEGITIVDQVPTRLIPDVIKNTNYKFVHRLTAPDDCEVMAASLALREDQKSMIPALEIGNAIVYGDNDDAAVWVKMNKPKE
ncbi:ATP-binding protein [Diplocloster agilis]|uniref:ATP-binding protein n=1 Tax=Diplocloster agilis TaxID=2850323 RepID=UPI0008208A1C|nr:ATP-binding protein [Suonthocola fibrivorans]MCU6736784.1 ATP-binding protein [Suonthocola fibrivorans]SCJ93610.1 Type IV secretory pathway%2C VirB4 components [uncultured Clostridium sp.]